MSIDRESKTVRIADGEIHPRDRHLTIDDELNTVTFLDVLKAFKESLCTYEVECDQIRDLGLEDYMYRVYGVENPYTYSYKPPRHKSWSKDGYRFSISSNGDYDEHLEGEFEIVSVEHLGDKYRFTLKNLELIEMEETETQFRAENGYL